MAAIQILAEIKRQGRPASEVLNVFNPVPQVLKNVRYAGKNPMSHPRLLSEIETANSELAGEGRVLIRASGTEPLIRVMSEGEDSEKVDALVDRFVEIIKELN